MGRTCSPPAHKEFSTPIGLLEFVQKLRDLSGGNLGLQTVSEGGEFIAICKAMIHTGITPDYIAIDGGEGYRALAQFSNHVDSLALIRWFCAMCRGFELRDKIRFSMRAKSRPDLE